MRASVLILISFVLAGCMKAERVGTDSSSPEGFMLGGLSLGLIDLGGSSGYTGAQFVAVGAYGGQSGCVVWRSYNGQSWVEDVNALSGCNAVGHSARGIAFGNRQWIAVGNTGMAGPTCAVWTSPDGINWTAATCAHTLTAYAVTYGNGLFVAAGASNGTNCPAMSSANGTDWSSAGLIPCASGTRINSLVNEASTGLFWASRTDGIFYTYNPATQTWSAVSPSVGSAAVTGTAFLYRGVTTVLSAWQDSSQTNRALVGSPTNWTSSPSSPGIGTYAKALASGTTTVIAGDDGFGTQNFFYSSDLLSWHSATPPAAYAGYVWNSMVLNEGLGIFAVGGYLDAGQNTFGWSTDGTVWHAASLTSTLSAPLAVNAIAAAQ